MSVPAETAVQSSTEEVQGSALGRDPEREVQGSALLGRVPDPVLGRDPERDSLDSDSLAGDEAPAADQQTSGPVSSSPRLKCFINASELGDGGDVARPDVLPPPPAAFRAPSPPPADLLSRLQHEEKLKGSLLFNSSGCSTPEVMGSPQRHVVGAVDAVSNPADRTDSPGSVFAEEDSVECPAVQQLQPDVVSAGAGDRPDVGLRAGVGGDAQDGSPARRAQPTSLDEVPIVAGHHEPLTPPAEPPRRPADPQTVFFVDLNALPAPAEPPPPVRPADRRESDSVYLYIDLNSESPTRAAGDAMSMSYHGATVASQRVAGECAATDAEGDESEDPGSDQAGAYSLFYTVGGTERPRRPPPELRPRPPRQEKRRRNLSLDCQARAERQRAPPAAPAHIPPATSAEQRKPPSGRASEGGTPEPARRPPRSLAPEPGQAGAVGRRALTGKPSDDPPRPAAQVSEPDPPSARSRVSSAPPRRRSAQRPEPRRKERPVAQLEPSKPQRTFLKSHSGRNAVSVPPPSRTSPACSRSGGSGGGVGPRTGSAEGSVRAGSSGGSSSGGTLTRRKAANASQQQAQPPPVAASPPRDSPASDDNVSDVSSAKSYNRQSPETRNRQGIDQLTSDLLQMLSDGLFADVTIQVAGQEVAAHRCVLSARCHYFRGLLTRPQHNVVRIDGHKLETVEFVLFHLYSGATYVPEDVDLSDLLTLAVMLQHKQLIRMAEFAMRVRLCHMFHKPCSECIPGVLETLCTAADCDLDDLAARCLAWVTQNRVAVWADPSFSEMTDEYRAWCFQEAATLSEDTVLAVVQDCRRLSVQLPAARWAQHVRDMVDTLLSNAVVFLSRHLGAILVSDRFLSLAERGECADLEQYMLAAADVQNSADAHTSLEVIGQLQAVPNHGWRQEFVGLLRRLHSVCRRRASGGQNYASIHLQRRSAARTTPPRVVPTQDRSEVTADQEENNA